MTGICRERGELGDVVLGDAEPCLECDVRTLDDVSSLKLKPDTADNGLERPASGFKAGGTEAATFVVGRGS